MDPDMVRQQEEAEREANGLATKEADNEAVKFAFALETPLALGVEPQPSAPKKKAPHPNRRALPPMGSGRLPQARIRHGLLHGVARFFAYALAGAMLGVIIGNVANAYLSLAPDRSATVVFSSAACFTLVCALISILHHEH